MTYAPDWQIDVDPDGTDDGADYDGTGDDNSNSAGDDDDDEGN